MNFSIALFHLNKLKEKIINFSTQGVLGDVGEDTPNRLIYNGGGRKLDNFW